MFYTFDYKNMPLLKELCFFSFFKASYWSFIRLMIIVSPTPFKYAIYFIHYASDKLWLRICVLCHGFLVMDELLSLRIGCAIGFNLLNLRYSRGKKKNPTLTSAASNKLIARPTLKAHTQSAHTHKAINWPKLI